MSEREGQPRSDGPASDGAAVGIDKSERSGGRGRWTWMIAVVLLFAAVGGYAITQLPDGSAESSSSPAPTRTAPPDSDDDGLSDKVEAATWVARGGTFRTDPNDADTDGDGLSDGEEAGKVVVGRLSEKDVYLGFSDPTSVDSDGDGLSDADEADLSLDPYERDTDDDDIQDAHEIDVVGTAPDVADTDGDGFGDGFENANREERGLDPLSADEKTEARAYAVGYAKGAVAGDLWREDSLAWLAGNITSGGTSSVPFFGSILGALFDLRDVVGSAIRADWVGSGFSAIGLVPGGDFVAVPGKVGKFVSRNPELAAATAAVVASVPQLSRATKVRAAKSIWGETWGELRGAGASENALLRLSNNKVDLHSVAAARNRASHVDGPPAKFFATGSAGEKLLENLYGVTAKGPGTQVSESTKGCAVACNSIRRRFDVVANGVAHESKVGRTSLTASVEKQLSSDAHLIETGVIQGAHWHFLASGVTNKLGPSKTLLDRLDELKIPYTIHLPA